MGPTSPCMLRRERECVLAGSLEFCLLARPAKANPRSRPIRAGDKSLHGAGMHAMRRPPPPRAWPPPPRAARAPPPSAAAPSLARIDHEPIAQD
jgi:hypothetical protein